MAFKRIDFDDSTLEGFSYENKSGEVEQVEINTYWATVRATGEKVDVYYEDIPNLIKALQAAYDHKKGR